MNVAFGNRFGQSGIFCFAFLFLLCIAGFAATEDSARALPITHQAAHSESTSAIDELKTLETITVRALRAWGQLPPRFVRLALELRRHGVDIMGYDLAQVLELTDRTKDPQLALHEYTEELNALAEFIQGMVEARDHEESTGANDMKRVSAHTLSEIALGLNAAEQYQEGLDYATMALTIQPDNPFSLSMKGWALLGLNRVDEAYNYLSQSLEIWPDNKLTLSNLLVALYRMGKCSDVKYLADKYNISGDRYILFSTIFDECKNHIEQQKIP